MVEIFEKIKDHGHTGTDARKINGRVSILNSPQAALTSATTGSISSGGVGSLNTGDQIILENMRTRLNEIETKLRALGFLL